MKKKIYGVANLTQFIHENKLVNPPETIFREIRDQEKQLVGFKPVCELIPVFVFETDPDVRFLQAYITLKYKGNYFKVHSETDKDTAFSLSFDLEQDHPYLQNFRYLGAEVGGKPNKISKATPAKMDAWLNFLIAEKEAKEKHITETTARLGHFLNRLNRFERIIIWDDNRKSGEILLHGLKFSFFIADDGVITQYMQLIPLKQDLETFIQMSDNKYNDTMPMDEEIKTEISFWEYALDYIKQLPVRKSETVRLYTSHIRKFNKLYPGIPLSGVNAGKIRNFENYMASTLHKSPSTTRLTVIFIHRVLKDAIEKGLLPADPFSDRE